MRYIASESPRLVGKFTAGSTATITITRLSDGDVLVDSAECAEISNGYFQYEFLAPAGYHEYLWTMTDGIDEVSGVVAIDGYPADLDVPISTRLAADDYVSPVTPEEIDEELSDNHGSGVWGPDAGLVSKVYTLRNSLGVPVPGVACWATTDEAGLAMIDIMRITNDLGQVTFQFNLPAGAHVWIWHRGAESGDPEVV